MSLSWMGNDPDLHRPTRRVLPKAQRYPFGVKPYTRVELIACWFDHHPRLTFLLACGIIGLGMFSFAYLCLVTSGVIVN